MFSPSTCILLNKTGLVFLRCQTLQIPSFCKVGVVKHLEDVLFFVSLYRDNNKSQTQIMTKQIKSLTPASSSFYRLIEVQDEAEEETVTAFKLKAHRGQSTHKVNQLHHRILKPRQSHVSGTQGKRESLYPKRMLNDTCDSF